MKSFFAFLLSLFKLVDKPSLSIRDKFWVLEAFIRGRVLKQDRYLPLEEDCLVPGFVLTSWNFTVPFGRMIALSALWGRRPAGIKDALRVLGEMRPTPKDPPIQYLYWEAGKWEPNARSMWYDRPSFLSK